MMDSHEKNKTKTLDFDNSVDIENPFEDRPSVVSCDERPILVSHRSSNRSYQFGERTSPSIRVSGCENFDIKGSSPSRRISLGTDTRFSLDPRAGLKAFRQIGGFDGISREELRGAVLKVQDEHVRTTLLKNLDEIFTTYDANGDGKLDVLEFETLVQGSTIAQQAVYQLLEQNENEENFEALDDLGVSGLENTRLDFISVSLTLLYMVNLVLQSDNDPTWLGWHFVELVFLIAFSVDVFSRCVSLLLLKRYSSYTYAVRRFLTEPINTVDITLTTAGWIEICVVLSNVHRRDAALLKTLRWARFLRIIRCARLIRVFWYCHELRVLVEGIISGLRAAFWGLVLIILIVFAWAIFLRTALVTDWPYPNTGTLMETLKNTPETMVVVFRCMALSADGSCFERDSKSIFILLSDQFGFAFDIAWLVSELFILIGVLNVVSSVFVVQAAENAAKIKESINSSSFRDDSVRLQSLDKLLRTLIHPGRTQSNPKDKNATEVARMIRTQYPEAAAKIPNMETQLVQFAKHIQDAKKLHQSAMDVYEAQEVTECKQLRNMPSAKTYMVDGEEQLLVDDVASASNSLNLPMAPMGAVEIMLVQEKDNLEQLLEEAERVQLFVKSLIYPNSDWESTVGAGSSGNIWKASKGLCDEAFDPGPKGVDRIEQKVHGKYGGRYARNRDYCRLSLIYKSVSHLIQAVPRFLEYRIDSDKMQVVSLENRFLQPHPLGWRDVTMLLKVEVPGSDECIFFPSTYHIMELQLRLKGLTDVCHEGHKLYEEIRASLPNDLVTTILDRLVTDTTLDLGITKSEWLQCLPNKEVRKLLDALGIPRRSLKSLFDTIDIDGSGTVTSSELTEMLRLVKDPVHAHELAGCHLRVRDIQRQLQTRLEPQLASMHNFAIRCMETQEYLMEALHMKFDDLFEHGGQQLESPCEFPNRQASSDISSVQTSVGLHSMGLGNYQLPSSHRKRQDKFFGTQSLPTSLFVKEKVRGNKMVVEASEKSQGLSGRYTSPSPKKKPDDSDDEFACGDDILTPRVDGPEETTFAVPKSIPSIRELANSWSSH